MPRFPVDTASLASYNLAINERNAARLAVLAVLLVLVAGCSDAPATNSQASRSALGEVFSTTDWPYCEAAERSLDSLGTTHPDSLVHIVWCQSPSHPELSTAAGDERSKRYNVAGFWPTAFFDGFYRAPTVPVQDSFYEVYDNMFGQARSLPAAMELSLDSATSRLDSSELSIGVHIKPTDPAVDSMPGLMLVAVVYEDSAPYYSLLRGETLYTRFCARRVIGDTWGIPLVLRFCTDYDTVLTTRLGDWNRSRLGAAVFVQDTSSLRVMQSVAKPRFVN